MKLYVYTYKVIKSDCKKKWKNVNEIPAIYDKLIDERRKDKKGKISCGCCMPPKDIILELIEKRPPRKTS